MVRRVSSSEELSGQRPRRSASSSPAVTTRVSDKAPSSHKRKRGAGRRTASKRDHASYKDRKEAEEEEVEEGSSSGGDTQEEEKEEDEVEDGSRSKQTLGDGFYEVEAVRKRRVRKGELQYLIKWCGRPESANTWEPFENVKECADIIEEFEKSRLPRSSKKGRGKRKAGASMTVEKKKHGISGSVEEGSAADIGDDTPDLPEESVESPLSAGGPNGKKSKVGDNQDTVNDNEEQGNMAEDNNVSQELQVNDVAEDVCMLPPLEGGEVRSVAAVNKADDHDEAASTHCDVGLRPDTSPSAEDTHNKVPLHSHDVPGTLDPSPEPPLGASLPRIASSNIPPGCSYAINLDGSIKAGECGKRVLHRMRELCQQIFRHEMFGFDWRKIDKSKKECVIAHLHEEFPVSSLACRFSDQWMIDKMGRYIRHRRAEARKAYGKEKRRPTWVAKEDWKKLKEEFEKQPEKWKQQKNAARARLEANIISHLGSGGWTSFQEDFFEYTGRAPTNLEREYAIKYGIKQLLARLNACDGQEALNKP